MTAQQILRMIETVDPADTATLDEIDQDFHFWLTGEYVCPAVLETHVMIQVNGVDVENIVAACPQYTRSLDAQKAIPTKGWVISFRGSYDDGKEAFQYMAEKLPLFDHGVFSEWLPTEELACLHAKIQTIDHDRRHNGEGES